MMSATNQVRRVVGAVALLADCIARGFDRSYLSAGNGGVRVGCSQCEAAVINGVACHEAGCGNALHGCRECGELIPRSMRLCADCSEAMI